jgi:hypothetical protein
MSISGRIDKNITRVTEIDLEILNLVDRKYTIRKAKEI